jgi:hypothetical protein
MCFVAPIERVKLLIQNQDEMIKVFSYLEFSLSDTKFSLDVLQNAMTVSLSVLVVPPGKRVSLPFGVVIPPTSSVTSLHKL